MCGRCDGGASDDDYTSDMVCVFVCDKNLQL